MSRSIIEIQDLSTGYKLPAGRIKFLHRGLNLSLKQGELVCVLGPNGSGKSTLLRTLLGFEKIPEGRVLINGKGLSEISIREVAKLISVVLTEKIDDFYLTAFEIALTGRYPYGSFTGRVSKEDKETIEEIFDQFNISHLLSRVFFKLSDGEKQRVMIARAIAQDTPFIFMDEPVAFIDSPGKVSIMHLVKELTSKYKKGILMATHDLDAAVDYADRLWLLGTDESFEEGMPEKLIESGSFNRFFDLDNVQYNTELRKFIWKE